MRGHHGTLVLLALTMATPTRSIRAQHSAAPRIDARPDFPPDSVVRSIIRQRVGEKRSAGIVVGLLEPNGHRRIVAFGDAGPGQPPLDGNSVFEIGSISKVFTATVLAELVMQGKVRLDDPAQRYLPASVTLPTRNGKAITLGSLSEQNSGLPPMPANFHATDATNPFGHYAVAQMYEFLSAYELTRDPGTQFEYSNLGVGLLGHVLSLISRTSYEEMERARVWAPLGMRHTSITLTPWMTAHLALGHDEQGRVIPNWDFSALAGAGAIRSTTNDMLIFAEANLHAERGALERAMAFAQRPRAPVGPPNEAIGLNWFTMRTATDTIVWHNGGTGGYRTFLGLEPSRKRAVVVMTNSGGEGPDDIGMHLLDPALPLAPMPAPPKPRTAIVLSAAVLAPNVGAYRLPAGDTLTVTLSGNELYVQGHQPKKRLWPETETDFFIREADLQITFVRDTQGVVTALVLHNGGESSTAFRITAR
jgi:D-alanyl-D-alanine-carboxypeptidase/D-alanyl-D-alanine-endopeptidase